MKQLLLATVLIAVPVAAFTGFQLYQNQASAAAGLGDLSMFSSIVRDVQKIAGTGDLPGAKTRIKDFEIAWDQAEAGLRPMDPARWDTIDEAADAALSALRTKTPDPAAVGETLAALQTALTDQKAVTK
ncbi:MULTISPECIES: hypothetical protein [unclassified Rhizobium]|uniref:hypothetical protein n=1 Tax=unclassified Rhizobium TaxID=2613769 RepID=UPI0006F552B2|nr:MULTISPECIES: hypothetical protein [unclassified Rhizobium]KQV44108.1 hypothetical protein ASC86_04840 [Rhizobium sp. Root1212]KRD38289.1 hypothetical protein ASE37_04840 [Rhizobium sp. Root268]